MPKFRSVHRQLNRWIFTTLVSVFCGTSTFAQTRWDGNEDRSRSMQSNQPSDLWGGSGWLGGGPAQQTPDWRLGVQGDNTQVGVRVREVVRNTPAERARIEVGDVIVTVNGFQVGMVGGRLYDLGEEINRRADASGNVTLVIQDHRNYGLASIQVPLENSQRTVSGTLVNVPGRALPADAIVTVQIENVTRPHYQVRHGQTRFRPQSGRNIPFEIAYDPNFIDPQDIYQVRAFVTSQGRMILDTRQPQGVLTRSRPSQVLLHLESVAPPSTGQGGVITAAYPNLNDVDDQLIALYRRYLRREPTFLELAALRTTPGIVDHLQNMPLELMAAQEYFDAAGNNNTVWLEKVFTEIVKRRPNRSEQEQWMRRYADLRFSRTELLRQLNAQVRR